MTALLVASLLTVFDSQGIPIRYVEVGQGEPVVLIHGWMGDATMWGRDRAGQPSPRPVPGLRLITFDCRGHGQSGKPHETVQYGPEMARDIVRLLNHLKIKKAHLVGYSMGTFLAGYVVANHPDRVLSVIYGGQAPLRRGKDDDGSAEVDAFVKAVEAKRLGDYLLFTPPADRPRPNAEQAEQLASLMFAGKDVRALAAAGKSFPRLAIDPKALAKAKVPTLFLYGEKEAESTRQRIEALRQVIPNCEVKEIAGTDHRTTLAHPDFGKTIVEFLSRRR